jgi:CO/xanthine dehydrogenase Mo-binding subunit
LRLLTDQGRYADDWNAPGQAYAAFVRSPHAYADVVAIDAAPARAVAGVLGVFTGRDLIADGVGAIPTLIAERGGGVRSRDGSPFAEPTWHPLATDRVRHVGEPVAIVVAATPAAAQDGAEAVAVRYTGRPAVVDAVAALADGAPPLHAGVAENRAYNWECGDPEATARAIATAAHVTRLTVLDNRLVTCFMEPRAALAEWDAGAGRYTLHASLQSVHQLAANLARILGVATDRVRCVTGDVGGGFGSKIQPYPEYVALAWAARRVGRPVKWVSSRSEGFVSDAQSRDNVLAGELALAATGHITALRVHSTSNLGAYVASGIPMSTILNMQRMVSGLYAIPAIHRGVRRFSRVASMRAIKTRWRRWHATCRGQWPAHRQRLCIRRACPGRLFCAACSSWTSCTVPAAEAAGGSWRYTPVARASVRCGKRLGLGDCSAARGPTGSPAKAPSSTTFAPQLASPSPGGPGRIALVCPPPSLPPRSRADCPRRGQGSGPHFAF